MTVGIVGVGSLVTGSWPSVEHSSMSGSMSSSTMGERVGKLEKEMLYLRQGMDLLLRGQIYGPAREGRDSTLACFTSPTSGVHFQTPVSPSVAPESNQRESSFPPPAPPRSVEPHYPMEPQYPPRSSEQRFPSPSLDHYSYSYPHTFQSRPLEIPTFDGHNPDDWLFRVEKCFEANRTHDAEKIDRVLPYLTGVAISWWRYTYGRVRISTWPEFKERCITRFRAKREAHRVAEYRDRFEELAVELPHVSLDVLESAFLKGLRKNLRDQVVRCRPTNLDEIVEVASVIEAQEKDTTGSPVRQFTRQTQFSSSLSNRHNEPSNFKKPFDMGNEMRRPQRGETKNSNPCRNCGEKWFHGHKCRHTRFKQLEVDEADEEEEEPIEQEREVEEEPREKEELVTLTLDSKSGLTNEKSMQMRGKIKGKEVKVLIDSGATSSFVDERLVQEMEWPIIAQRKFSVQVGGGNILRGRGVCAGLKLETQGVEIIQDFLVFDLGSVDVVLGYPWLASLGETKTNWGLQGISWKIDNHWVTVAGDPTISKSQVSLNSMERLFQHTDVVYCLELAALFEDKSEKKDKIEDAEIYGLLSQFQKVFSTPQNLPPPRNREHAITLQEGAGPVNLRPY
ncbi:hypothetical protein CARUB_v10007371mg, partial [Capsella rubella]